MNNVILIPAYNPTNDLIILLSQLNEQDNPIIVVNDGSESTTKNIFEDIQKKYPNIMVVHHKQNQGKGAALKTGFKVYLEKFAEYGGVITADADGQHRPEDIMSISKKLTSYNELVILGVRNFCKNIPLKSRYGNIITRNVMRLFYGINISDTQTGLRGIPRNLVPIFQDISYDKYEFETEMLICAKKRGVQFFEEKIETIYVNNNEGSHFNPIVDSMKVYFVLFRFIFSSILASIIDIVFFTILFNLTGNIIASILISRYTLGAGINFYMNWKKVFKSKVNFFNALFKYYLLATVLGVITFFIMKYLISSYNINVIITKVLTEGALFFVSFLIQKKWFLKS